MKKNILAVIFVIALSSVGAIAQTVFVPRPPVVYIPQLDPVRMQIQNEVNRSMTNGATKPSATKGANTASRTATKNTPPAAVGATAFKPRAQNYLPKVLAQKNGGSADQQREEEQFYESLIDLYEQAADNDNVSANDLAYGFEYFLVNNYNVYHHHNNLEAITMAQEKKIYSQFRNSMQTNPDIKKMNDEQKQTATEFMAIMTGAAYKQYVKGVNEGNEQLMKAGRQMAKENLENFFKVPIEKIKISDSGFQIQ